MECNTIKILIQDKDIGERLDKTLSKKLKNMSRNRIQSLIRDGCVLYNSKKIIDQSQKISQIGYFLVSFPPNKKLKILSARPDPKNYQSIKHHLYGFQDAKKNFSTGDWLKIANKKIIEVKKRKKIPILVGGTGLYFKALTDGLVQIPNIPIKFRNQIRNLINGTAKRIIKEGHVFNRIHVADIARIIYTLSVSDIKSDIFNFSLSIS